VRQGKLLFILNLAMQPHCILRQNKNSITFLDPDKRDISLPESLKQKSPGSWRNQ
jgi:hypothetical protein